MTERYRLNTTLHFDGQPVNWNARAHIWHGADWRYHLRRPVRRLSGLLKRRGFATFGLWLFRVTDNRDRHYSGHTLLARRLLGTVQDVEARQAWIVANKYWRGRERAARQKEADR